MTKIGVYPGTFDPFTKGHLDIVERSLFVVDRLYIAVAMSSNKTTIFSAEERTDIISDEIKFITLGKNKEIIVTQFEGLLVDFAIECDANTIIRGIRAVSDFEYEFQMSCMNSKLSKNIQTIFLPASEKMQLVSSKMVKEVVRLGGNIPDFISEEVKIKLQNYYKQN